MTRILAATVVAAALALAGCGDGEAEGAADTATASTPPPSPSSTTDPEPEGSRKEPPDDPGAHPPPSSTTAPEPEGALACLPVGTEYVIASFTSQATIPGLSGSGQIEGTGGALHFVVYDDGAWAISSVGPDPDLRIETTFDPLTGSLAVDGVVGGSMAESGAGHLDFTVEATDGQATTTVEGSDFAPTPLSGVADLFSPEGRAEVTCDGDEVILTTDALDLVLAPTDDTVLLDRIEG